MPSPRSDFRLDRPNGCVRDRPTRGNIPFGRRGSVIQEGQTNDELKRSAFGRALDARGVGAGSPDRTRARCRAVATGASSLRLGPERGGRGDGPHRRACHDLSCRGLLAARRGNQQVPGFDPTRRLELARDGVPRCFRRIRRQRRVAALACRGAAPDSGGPADADVYGEPAVAGMTNRREAKARGGSGRTPRKSWRGQ